MHEPWDDSTDIVVVGAGAAGLPAAIAAADAGASVLLTERSPKFGGSLAISGGKFWAPCNHLMAQLGIPDTPELALEYLRHGLGDAYPEMVRTYVEWAPRVARYLEEATPHRFLACPDYPDYHPEWPGASQGGRVLDTDLFDATCLGENLPLLRRSPSFLPFTQAEWERWRSVHKFDWNLLADRIRRNIVSAGCGFAAGLVRGCMDRPSIRMWLQTRARRLIWDGREVQGIQVEREGRPLRIRARKAVILASGGFEWNQELRQRFLRGPVEAAASPPWNEGDGLLMGAALGAGLGNTAQAWWFPVLHVPGDEMEGQPLYRMMLTERALPGSIIVNRAGRRFVNEAHNYNDITKTFHHFDPVAYDWENVPAWLIFDGAFQRHYAILTIMPGEPVPDWVVQAPTLRELAAKLGADPDGLQETVTRFNRQAEAGRDTDFHRGDSAYDRYYGDTEVTPNPNLAPLTEAPFFAIRVYAGCIGTKGGLITDVNGQVLDVWDQAIPRLYGAGNVAGFWLGQAYPGAGASVGPCVTFGYLAAQHAARS